MNKRGAEILHNTELLCFIDKNNIKKFFTILKENISLTNNEKRFIKYLERVWIKKPPEIYNYSEIINQILKLKNKYIISKGDNNSENLLFSEIKSLNKLFLTNNICESMHGKISMHLPNKNISKNNFRDTINYIFNCYEYKKKEFVRRDYISRTLIILILKYNINDKPFFVNYNIFGEELNNTISIMTRKAKLNVVNEIKRTLEYIEENNDNNKNIDISELASLNSNSDDNDDINESFMDEFENNSDYLLNFEIFNVNQNNSEDEENKSISNEDNLNNFKNINLSSIDNTNSNNINNDNIDLDIPHIFENRGFLNIFTLNFDDDKSNLSDILLKKNVILDEGDKNMNAKLNKKRKYSKKNYIYPKD